MKSPEKLSWAYSSGWVVMGVLALFLVMGMLLSACITVPPYEPPPYRPQDPEPKEQPQWNEDHWDEPDVIIL